MEFVELVSPTRLDNSAAKTGREPCLKVNAGSVMCEVRNDELSTPDAREDPIRNIVIVMDTVDPYTYARTWTVSPFAVLVACLAFGIIGDAVSRSMVEVSDRGRSENANGAIDLTHIPRTLDGKPDQVYSVSLLKGSRARKFAL